MAVSRGYSRHRGGFREAQRVTSRELGWWRQACKLVDRSAGRLGIEVPERAVEGVGGAAGRACLSEYSAGGRRCRGIPNGVQSRLELGCRLSRRFAVAVVRAALSVPANTVML